MRQSARKSSISDQTPRHEAGKLEDRPIDSKGHFQSRRGRARACYLPSTGNNKGRFRSCAAPRPHFEKPNPLTGDSEGRFRSPLRELAGRSPGLLPDRQGGEIFLQIFGFFARFSETREPPLWYMSFSQVLL
jgi:hypothetical protein